MITPTIIAIDTTGLSTAVRTSLEYSGRVPTVAAATAGFYVAREAVNLCRRADIGQIDSKLGVTVSPMLVTRKNHPRLGLPVKSGRKLINVEQSLAMMLIVARLKHTSNTNIRENWRFMLYQQTFSKGSGTAGFWNKVREKARDLVSSRHKSIAFIASSLIPVIKDLEQYVAPKYRQRMPARDSQAENAASLSLVPKGRGIVRTSENSAIMEGQGLIGIAGVPDNLNDLHNQALWKYLAPAIQKAIYNEEAKQWAYVGIKGYASEYKAKLASSGVIIDV